MGWGRDWDCRCGGFGFDCGFDFTGVEYIRVCGCVWGCMYVLILRILIFLHGFRGDGRKDRGWKGGIDMNCSSIVYTIYF